MVFLMKMSALRKQMDDLHLALLGWMKVVHVVFEKAKLHCFNESNISIEMNCI